jgi:ParB-like chromosome segregation protein Spo0J
LLEGAEFDELVADIKANGQTAPIVTYEGMILDGRNRYRACLAGGVHPLIIEGDDIDDPVAFVISTNIRRRHLTGEQRDELAVRLLKANPEKSDRQIAKTVGRSPTRVGKVRSKMESAGDVSTVDTRTDTKGRKQPAKKASGWSRERYKAHRERKRKRATKVQPGTDPSADIVKEAFDLVLRMNDEQRVRFFDLYLERYGDQKYRGKFTEAWREGESKAAPQPDDGLDIPGFLLRAPKAAAS